MTMVTGLAPKCLRLWHGTSVDPRQVHTKDGFKIDYSRGAGPLGKGIYFAVNANYSCPNYSFKVPG